MSIDSRLSSDGKTLTIGVRGRFDFSVVNEFRGAYEAKGKGVHYVIDLKQAEHIDSSALGMLLNMRSFLGGDEANIQIIHCAPGIRKILEISRFDKKFQIS
ncbi:MAG: STAS domain-containing protein [Hahellaceae bacterium]|jgi:anti-anti-sigma factor|nr:STAS domain-containing protein [Hahellaceae bacterium]